jgi:hypothetical protein
VSFGGTLDGCDMIQESVDFSNVQVPVFDNKCLLEISSVLGFCLETLSEAYDKLIPNMKQVSVRLFTDWLNASEIKTKTISEVLYKILASLYEYRGSLKGLEESRTRLSENHLQLSKKPELIINEIPNNDKIQGISEALKQHTAQIVSTNERLSSLEFSFKDFKGESNEFRTRMTNDFRSFEKKIDSSAFELSRNQANHPDRENIKVLGLQLGNINEKLCILEATMGKLSKDISETRLKASTDTTSLA